VLARADRDDGDSRSMAQADGDAAVELRRARAQLMALERLLDEGRDGASAEWIAAAEGAVTVARRTVEMAEDRLRARVDGA
jgi:hypothetical protein